MINMETDWGVTFLVAAIVLVLAAVVGFVVGSPAAVLLSVFATLCAWISIGISVYTRSKLRK
jgi:hypothetical protein